jgi:transposase
MNRRKYTNDPSILLKEGKEIMLSHDGTRYYFRVFSVNFVLNGMSAAEVAEIAGVSRSTVSNWVKLVDEKGFEALKTVKQSGRPSRLTADQKSEIDIVLQREPSEFGYKVWDGPTLSAYINKTYDIELSTRQCQRLFHELGYSKIRPQVFPSKGYEDTEARNELKKTEK